MRGREAGWQLQGISVVGHSCQLLPQNPTSVSELMSRPLSLPWDDARGNEFEVAVLAASVRTLIIPDKRAPIRHGRSS